MRFSRFNLIFAALCLVFGNCLLTAPAFADSFNIYRVASGSGATRNYGLTDSGSLATVRTGFGPTDTYTMFTPPGTSVVYNGVPPFTFDNGSSCSVSYAGLSNFSRTTCNGQYTVFSAFNQTDYFSSFYMLTGGTLQKLYYGEVSQVLLNAIGDVGFVGLFGADADTNYLYYNNTSHAAAAVTPEPSSAVLLLSGACCCVMLFWRQRRTLTT